MQHQINTTQNQQADRFTLTDACSGIRIIFLPQMLRGNRGIPQLDYKGSEGQFTFRGDEVKQQQSNLGLLISIALKTNVGEELDFALVLPSVNLAGQKKQDFETVAIATTKSRKVDANQAGIQFNCQVLTLKGYAENLSMVAPVSVPSVDWQNPSWFPYTKKHEDRFNLMDFQRF
ncbi:hypothetical protein [Chlorogloea sp. CCALA 695]|uniref:hypothetical protein n=1 Tax=Chlorogloea sp. CCALA 695 TaxID=2107693 RepID=UPI000D071495|nr:hypothetical protein [Chlorogloea sp. CCALA 695]PSB34150.1 hypothetical protein C7B70_04100 [Chlorogloea sp. CCALA 695]